MAGEGKGTVTSTARAVMLGPPGSGKGTQAALLAKALGIPTISTGEMLRQAVEAKTELGDRVAEIVNSGTLVDDETMAEVVRERLTRADTENGFLLDGYPRTMAQASALERILDDLAVDLDSVVFVDVPEEELIRRALGRQRADDTREVIEHRLAVYRDKTEHLVDHYEGRGLLLRVNGDQPVEVVAKEILAVLAGRLD